jgi:hypothetical protein
MKNVQEYTMEIIDIVMKAANIEDIYKHKILKQIYKNESYRKFKTRILVDKKSMAPRKPQVKLVFHTLPASIQRIIILSCQENEVDLEVFCSNTRKEEVLEAQRMVIFFLHKKVGYNSVRVAMWFMKHHSTILHACNVHETRIETEKIYTAIYKRFSEEAMKIISEA